MKHRMGERWIMGVAGAALLSLWVVGCRSVETPLSREALAERGDAQAQFQLGQAYCLGDGVPQDVEKGLTWLRRSAEQGNAMAQWALGLHLLNGGPHQDREEAHKWLKASEEGLLELARQGNGDAQYQLGVLYFLGEGVPKDKAKAKEWLEKAVDQGVPNAINVLYQTL